MIKQNFKFSNFYLFPSLKCSDTGCFKCLNILLLCSIFIQATIIIYTTINYYIGYIDIISTSNSTAYDICIILPLILSIYVLFTSLNMKNYLLYYYVNQLLIILLLILKEIIYYIYKAIINSIKFRLKVHIITLSLMYMGLDNNIICYMIVFYILISLTIATYKSNSRSKLISKLILNLAIIITF